jgi:hypothetical protein
MADYPVNSNERSELPPCSRCGAEIGEDEEILMVFSKTDEEIKAGGTPVNLGDLGDLVKAYCERCSIHIEEVHELHDEVAEEFRDELDSYGN